MFLLSQASHPNYRPMTAIAAVATILDGLKPGTNVMPKIVDDITGKGEIPVSKIRMCLSTINKDKKITTRMIDGKLVVFYFAETKNG